MTAVEQVATPIGGLDAVAVDVRQGELADLPRCLGAFGGPVPEAGAESVRHGADLQLPHHLAHRMVALHAALLGREHEVARVGQFTAPLVEYGERPVRQRHAVLRAAFMRSAGTVQTAASRSISSYVAPRNSAERTAVSTRNSNESTAPRYAPERRTFAIAAPT